MATVKFFAAAAHAAGTEQCTISAETLADVKDQLIADVGPAFAPVLAQCSVLVDGEFATDPHTTVAENTVVEILPPFAGG